MASRKESNGNPTTEPPRRSFLYQAVTAALGTVVGAAPLLSGLAVFFSPLGRKTPAGKWVPIAPLDAVPSDGKPVRFPVITERRDAWNAYPPAPVGSVYLRRTADAQTPVCFTTVCPHLGCSVDYKPAQGHFLCPCHNSQFALDGARTSEESPSPRGMDTLDVKIEQGVVWIDYRTFKGGVAAKIEE